VYRFDWDAFVTPVLLSQIAGIAGVSSEAQLGALGPLLSQLFARVGGLPFSSDMEEVDRRTERATALLHEAVKHVLRTVRDDTDTSGYTRRAASDSELEEVVSAVERVPVNRATAERMEGLSGISATLANRIVEERMTGGPFGSLDELDDRVSGIGPATRERIEAAVRFDTPADLLSPTPLITGDFAQDLTRLVELQEGDPAAKLEATVRLLVAETAAHPHPATRHQRIRDPLPEWAPPSLEVDWLGFLYGSDYYHRLPDLLSSAVSSLDVCMFHIAVPGESHPTHRMLDALQSRHEAGATVRVLLDSDRESDPYRSTVINTPAKERLTAAGVSCRFDRPDRLLHSKFIVIDTSLVVLGSHNWSAGSYFRFDDLSLVIASQEFALELGARFDSLWIEAGP
jgi:DNA uptake protein ComE-like DNA-binding protein